ncbi:SAM hydrolase/SAM-dependent halogenase family protein [Persephonella sp.]
MNVVALLTDFGTQDGFIGAVKGVISSINPAVNIIDISHEVDSFDILEGALILSATYRYFPEGTVFVSVVDPGVGTERKPIVIKTEKYFFVAPDNGIVSIAVQDQKVEKIIHIKNKQFILERFTETFHGRDIFAPVAAYITRGVPVDMFGEELESINKIRIPEPEERDDLVVGQVIKFDKFGNCITNIKELPDFYEIKVNNHTIKKVVKSFLEGDKDNLNLIKGSFGFYEIFLPEKNCKEIFNIKKGDKVIIKKI